MQSGPFPKRNRQHWLFADVAASTFGRYPVRQPCDVGAFSKIEVIPVHRVPPLVTGCALVPTFIRLLFVGCHMPDHDTSGLSQPLVYGPLRRRNRGVSADESFRRSLLRPCNLRN